MSFGHPTVFHVPVGSNKMAMIRRQRMIGMRPMTYNTAPNTMQTPILSMVLLTGLSILI